MNPKHYMLTLKTKRDASFERTAEPIIVNELRGMLVSKTFDSGSYLYGGALDHLLVKRSDWKVMAVTRTRVWTEETARGQVAFR
jgi:hypothetical protein